VPQVGAQQREPGRDVTAVAVPGQQGGHGEAVAQVVNPGPTCPGRGGDPGRVEYLRERVRDVVGVQPPAPAVGEERRRRRVRAEQVATAGVDPQRAEGAEMHRHDPGLAEFRPPHGQHTLVQIDVALIQAAGLADAQSAGGQQPDHRGVGQAAEPGPQQACGLDQVGQLLRRVQVGRGASIRMRQHVHRRHLGRWIQGLQVAGEDPHHHQPSGPPQRILAAGRVDGPGHRRVRGHRDDGMPLAVGDEVHQQPALRRQHEPQRSPGGQVLLGRLPQPTRQPAHIVGRHADRVGGVPHARHGGQPRPGQGRATPRSRVASTLA
jgi:hypothetical protein